MQEPSVALPPNTVDLSVKTATLPAPCLDAKVPEAVAAGNPPTPDKVVLKFKLSADQLRKLGKPEAADATEPWLRPLTLDDIFRPPPMLTGLNDFGPGDILSMKVHTYD
jgi:hypothetical protein